MNGAAMKKLGRWVSTLLLLCCVGAVHAASSVRDELTLRVGPERLPVHAIHKKSNEPNGHSPVVFVYSYGALCADAFDAPGYSWMDELAREGFETWAIDLQGLSPAVASASLVVRDLRERSSTKKVTLMGWGWSGLVAAMVAIEDPNSVDRLVLLGAMDDPKGLVVLDSDALLQEWKQMRTGIDDDVNPAAYQQVTSLVTHCAQTTSTAKVPDLSAWDNNFPFKPTEIQVPTLVLRGDHDTLASGMWTQKIPDSREILLKNSSHWVPFENGRTFLYLHVSNFLAHKQPRSPRE